MMIEFRMKTSAALFWSFVAFTIFFILPFISMVFILSSFMIEVFFFITHSNYKKRYLPNNEESMVELENELIREKFDGKFSHISREIFVQFKKRSSHAIHIQSKSTEEDSPTILLLHGNGASAACWIDCFEYLSRSHNVLALDLPGFGRANGSYDNDTTTSSNKLNDERDSTISFYVDFIHSFLKEMNLERVDILAHSYGAFLAIHFSSEHPGRVSNLVLADAAGVFPTLGSYGAYWAFIFKASPISRFCRLFGVWPILAWFKALGCGANYFYWYSVLSSPNGWGDIHLSKFITVGWCRAFWNKPAFDLLVKLSEKVPVATVYGELDEIIPSHQGEIIRDSLGIPFNLIKNAGHSPIHGEDAKHFSEAVLSSLSSNRYLKDHSYGIRPFFGEPSSGWEEKYSSSFSNLQTKRVISRLYSDIITN